MDYICFYNSPLGRITLASDGIALTGLWFDNQKYYGYTLSEICKEKELTVFTQTIKWLDVYFNGIKPDFTPAIHMKTMPFRKLVWEIMLKIPYGKTMTYKDIADIIAKQNGIKKMSAQAVGGAVGHNAVSIIIPCHRVVGSNGNLTGYAGGLDRKISLLKLEKTDMSSMYIPKK